MKRSLRDPRIEELGLQLVQCPSQPGRLSISNQSCAERYNLAQKGDHRFPKDEFGLALMSGLKICKSCPEGRYFWENKDWPNPPRPVAEGKESFRVSESQRRKEESRSEPEEK